MKNWKLMTALLVSSMIVIESCKDNTEPEPAKPTLGELFAKAIEDTLLKQDIGYSFVVIEDGKTTAQVGGGLKSRKTDPEGEKPFTVDTKMHIASMTKTLTGIAFLRLAQQKGLKTSDVISKYLPSNWSQGANINKITFGDLMTHRSGITGVGNTCSNGSFSENVYAGLKQIVQKGTTTRGNYCYQNANMGLFRLLIPSILGYKFTSNETIDDTETQRLYLEYLQKEVFDKAGVANVQYTQPANNITYTYDFPYSKGAGWNTGTFNRDMGAYGIYLTAAEAAKIYSMALTPISDQLLNVAYRDTLLTKQLTCFRATTSSGVIANYHDGWWYWTQNSQGAGLRTLWMTLPDKTVCVLFVNALRYNSSTKQMLFPFNNGAIVSFVLNAYNRAKLAKTMRLAADKPFEVYLEHPEDH